MSGRLAAWILLPLLAAAVAVYAHRGWSRVRASRELHVVEQVTLLAVRSGRLPVGLLHQNLRVLRRAADRDPLEVGILIAMGSQYQLLQRDGDAAELYRRALALEPRPETYLNLARVEQRTDPGAAQADRARAFALDPNLERLER